MALAESQDPFLLENQDLVGHLTSESLPPPQYKLSSDAAASIAKKELSEAFIKWRKWDCLRCGWITTRLSKEAFKESYA